MFCLLTWEQIGQGFRRSRGSIRRLFTEYMSEGRVIVQLGKSHIGGRTPRICWDLVLESGREKWADCCIRAQKLELWGGNWLILDNTEVQASGKNQEFTVGHGTFETLSIPMRRCWVTGLMVWSLAVSEGCNYEFRSRQHVVDIWSHGAGDLCKHRVSGKPKVEKLRRPREPD